MGSLNREPGAGSLIRCKDKGLGEERGWTSAYITNQITYLVRGAEVRRGDLAKAEGSAEEDGEASGSELGALSPAVDVRGDPKGARRCVGQAGDGSARQSASLRDASRKKRLINGAPL